MKLCVWCLCCAGSAFGLGYNPQQNFGDDFYAVRGGFSGHPHDDAVVAIEWPLSANWFATAAVIAPDVIITAAHWRTVAAQSGHPRWPIGAALKRIGQRTLTNDYVIVDERHDNKSDIMVCRIKKTDSLNPVPDILQYPLLADANFPEWVDLYRGTDLRGKLITMGSFGRIETHWTTWCDQMDSPQIKQLRGPGLLHWGRNRITQSTPYAVVFTYDLPAAGGWVAMEAYGTFGNSGSPWFIADSTGTWYLVSFFTGCNSGPQLQHWSAWIAEQINAW